MNLKSSFVAKTFELISFSSILTLTPTKGWNLKPLLVFVFAMFLWSTAVASCFWRMSKIVEHVPSVLENKPLFSSVVCAWDTLNNGAIGKRPKEKFTGGWDTCDNGWDTSNCNGGLPVVFLLWDGVDDIRDLLGVELDKSFFKSLPRFRAAFSP